MGDEEYGALVIREGVKQALQPFHDLLQKLLGPAAVEVGGSLGDQVKVWRFKRQIRLLEEVKRLVEQSGLDIKPVATRLFFPILEAASVEDDDDMQTRWAALLANEATSVGSVHPSFIELLKQLAPGDARLLDKFYELRLMHPRITLDMLTVDEGLKEKDNVLESWLNLVRVGLVTVSYELDTLWNKKIKILGQDGKVTPLDLKSDAFLDQFAVKFVQACRAPTKQKSSK